jgi:Ca-activated chloride channel family protein
MNDELDKLKKAFAQAPEIKPSSEAKKAAMNAAISAFEQEKVKNHQGKSVDDRLKERDNTFVNLITFSKWRKSMKLKYLLPGAAGLAALSLVAVNTHQFKGMFTDQAPPIFVERDLDLQKESMPLQADDMAQTSAEEFESINLQPEPIGRESKANLVASPKPAPVKTARLEERVRSNKAKQENTVGELVGSKPLMGQSLHKKQRNVAFSDAISSSMGSASGMMMPIDPESMPMPQREQGRDKFEQFDTNPLKLTQQEPVSTFSIDVDTASYSFMRASLNQNVLPQKDAVRIEELINYFPYHYAAPDDKNTPFNVSTTVMPSPWNKNTKLLHIGIKGYELQAQNKPHANLVFLLDTSGSMNQPNKLPLLINSFKLLLSTLAPDDTVSIVTYAGSAGTVLEPTKVQDKAEILNALSRLNAGGSTAGGEGIRLAYQLAEANFNTNGINRVILATDGDFNVGIQNQEEFKSFIERKRESGVSLSVLGFGMGNYNDALMQTLAQNGNGNAAYIDSLSEARKVLVEEASSTLFTIAKDVKIQMEFNPAAVSEYRLIGYETRQLKREDFNNDKVDAGDIGAGHTVTAIYEITPADSAGKLVDDLRYQNADEKNVGAQQTEYGFLKLRYKLPDENTSKLIKKAIRIDQQLDQVTSASNDVRFASAVAAYGQLLRGGRYTADYTYDDVISLAQTAQGQDEFGYRSEFINLVRLAKSADALQSQ